MKEKSSVLEDRKEEYFEGKGKLLDWLWRNKKKDEFLGLTIIESFKGVVWQLTENLSIEEVSKIEGWKRIVDILEKVWER